MGVSNFEFKLPGIKRILLSLFLVMAFLPATTQERILSYDIFLEVDTEGVLQVRENIRVVAEGKEIKRGIYRLFPTRYKDRMGNRFNVGFEVTEVLKNGISEPWFTEKKSNGVMVYIGNKDKELVPGVYDYTLSYRTTRQIGFFTDYDELYYNAIGGDWVFPIETATVTLKLPEGGEILQKAAYSGLAGSTGCDCTLSENGNVVTLITTRALQPREQLTIAVGWPKGLVTPPSEIKKTSYFLKDNLNVLVAVAGLCLVFSLYFSRWRKYGKDPAKGTIIPLFDPPEGFSPAAIAYLMKMGMNDRVVTSAMVNLAVKGYLKIERQKRKYSLEQISDTDVNLTSEERILASRLFLKNKIITLNNKNHEVFQGARDSAEIILKNKLVPQYFSRNSKHIFPGLLISIALVILTAFLSGSPVVPFVLFLIVLLLAILFGWLMKAPTVKGRAAMDESEGFKMYLSVAEKDTLDKIGEPELTPERFEALLPYAIALGVENQWGKKFENVLKRTMQKPDDYRPAWYAASGALAFSPQSFASSMGKSFSSAISSSSTPPGSSSGSGGGGSAGGGGGGGGGGW